MPLVYMRRYTRPIIQANPEWYFVFGDNLERSGFGGQAREARGEPNAIGIATKKYPSNHEGSFFTDSDMFFWASRERDTLAQLSKLIGEKKVIVWPLDGIGTGLAQLHTRAPRIHRAIGDLVKYLEDLSEI